MKKNKMMRLASLLLVAVLLTTSIIGGTFAKYVTTASASDNARVAAWGFGENVAIDFDLFDTTYGTTVSSSGQDNVIAPGTAKEETITFTYADTAGKGAPEVAYKVTLAVDTENTKVDAAIKDNTAITWSFNGAAYGTWDAMIAAINSYSEDVAANELPDLEKTGLTIGWKWNFYSTDAQDKIDTAMGDAATLATCKLAINMTATQVD